MRLAPSAEGAADAAETAAHAGLGRRDLAGAAGARVGSGRRRIAVCVVIRPMVAATAAVTAATTAAAAALLALREAVIALAGTAVGVEVSPHLVLRQRGGQG